MPDAELFYEVHDGDGPFLLLVHGMMSSRAQWDLNLAALAEVTRPVVVELWGHGRSPAPDDPALYHPDAYVEALETIRVALGAERWALCGQSFGATLTIRYALRFPERVVAQLFTNSVSALVDPETAARMLPEIQAMADALDARGRAAVEQMPPHPKRARRLPPAAKDALVRDATRIDPRGLAHNLRVAVPVASLHERVGSLRVPTLLVCGEREGRFERYRRYAEAVIPGLEVAGFEAGHAVNIEAAAGFDAAATAFLRRHVAAGPRRAGAG